MASSSDMAPLDTEGLMRRSLWRKRIKSLCGPLLWFAAIWAIVLVVRWFAVPARAPIAWAPPAWLLFWGVLSFPLQWLISEGLSRAFAHKAVAEQLRAQGDNEAAAGHFQQAVELLSRRRGNPAVQPIIADCERQCSVCGLVTGRSLADLPATVSLAIRSGDPVRAAPLLAEFGRVLAATGRWPEIERPLLNLADRLAPSGGHRLLAPALGELGEQSYAFGRYPLADRLLRASVEASPFKDESLLMAQSSLADLAVVRGETLDAARSAAQALTMSGDLNAALELSSPDVGDPWRMIEGRINRPLPCPPQAYLFLVLSAFYRGIRLPALAWQCCTNGFRGLWQYRGSFPQWPLAASRALVEFGLIAWQGGRLALPLVPSRLLPGGLLCSPWDPAPVSPPGREMQVLGLSTLQSHFLPEDQAQELNRAYVGRNGPPSAALQALSAACNAKSVYPSGTVPASELDPWELSRWAIMAQMGGDSAQSLRLHEAAALRAARAAPDRSLAWLDLRWARALHSAGRDSEALAVCRRAADAAHRQGWTREAAAALDVMLDVVPSADVRDGTQVEDELSELLGTDPALEMELTRHIYRCASRAHGSGNLAAAREGMVSYVERIAVLQKSIAAAGLPTRVDPDLVADAHGVIVDAWASSDVQRAVEWSDRSKLWNIRRDDWRPVLAPVQATWVYPFAAVRRKGASA